MKKTMVLMAGLVATFGLAGCSSKSSDDASGGTYENLPAEMATPDASLPAADAS